MKKLIDIASSHMMRLVATSALAWPAGVIRIRNGGERMICSQNSTPTANMLPCISRMCTVAFRSARSNSGGICQPTITTLKATTTITGRTSALPAARSGRVQPACRIAPR